MSALAREPLTARDVRRLVYGRLDLWGSIQKHGPLAAPKGEITGGAFGSRLPVPTWCTDLTLAFAALNPDTAGLGRDGRTAWLLHAPFNDQQRVIWAYYVERPDDSAPDTRRADAMQWQHERERERSKAVKDHNSERDAAVARLLHLDSRAVRYLRQRAVWTMATHVGWERD